MTGFQKFTNQLEILKALFGLTDEKSIKRNLNRLEWVFLTSEKKWRYNLTRLKKVEYLLIAEAPPWTEIGEMKYFYGTFQPPLANRIWHAFFPSKKLPQHVDTALDSLGQEGFLLIDSLPFSMKYSSRLRKTLLYRKLIKDCLPILMDKINDAEIRWAQEVKVAFAFELNGKAVIEGLPGGLPFPNGQVLRLTEDLISADGSGYPGLYKLRQIWGLN
jgi:hypothetical protein